MEYTDIVKEFRLERYCTSEETEYEVIMPFGNFEAGDTFKTKMTHRAYMLRGEGSSFRVRIIQLANSDKVRRV